MHTYPPAVASIVKDYLERVERQLRGLASAERDEFLKQIHSHIYEAYRRMDGDDDVSRILGVLRGLGEPSELISDQLPGAMMRSARKRSWPLYICGAILVALFGLPLGFGGAAVLIGLLCAMAAIVFAYYMTAGSVVFAGSVFALAGFVRLTDPGLWNYLVRLGAINPHNDFFAHASASTEAFVYMGLGAIFIAGGSSMWRAGKRLLGGLRFLFNLAGDCCQAFAKRVRRAFSRNPIAVPSRFAPYNTNWHDTWTTAAQTASHQQS